MNQADFYLLALDVGGTKTAALLAHSGGDIIERVEVATRPQDGFDAAFGRITAAADKIVHQAESRGVTFTHIGVSIGGPLDVERGIIHSPPNLPGWDDIPLKQLLEDRYNIHTVVEHDGIAGALAEHRFGAGKGLNHLVFLTLGTGLGAGMILNGVPYRGASGCAGSIGHIRMAEDGPVAWGKAGSWEAFSSGAGIAAYARWRYPKHFPPEVTARDIAQLASRGDDRAEEVLDTAAKYLGRGLAILIDTLNPEMIVLGSLASRLGGRLLDPALELAEKESEPLAWRACRIVPSALGERLGDLAPVAAVLAREEYPVLQRDK